MVEQISENLRIARKDHDCMASEFVRESLNEGIFNFSEYRDIVKAKKNDWKIKKGQKYLDCVCVADGHIYSFKAIIEMDYLCRFYDLYEDC